MLPVQGAIVGTEVFFSFNLDKMMLHFSPPLSENNVLVFL